jgi:beta-galactosidase
VVHPRAGPHDSTIVTLGYRLPTAQPGHEYFLGLALRQRDSVGLVPAGYPLATEQMALPVSSAAPPIGAEGQPPLQVARTDRDITVTGGDVVVRFDVRQGTLTGLRYKGTDLIQRGLQPNLWRPATDNDWGNGLPRRTRVWRYAAQSPAVSAPRVRQPSPGVVEIQFDLTLHDDAGADVATFATSYSVFGSGDVVVEARLAKIGNNVELPRMGMNLVMPDGFDRMTWFGRGPFENYWDRKTAAFVGRYTATVASQFTPYVRPQENGNKTDVRWVAISNGTTGLLAVGAPLLEVEAHHNLPEDFETPGAGFVDRDATINRHISDIVPRPLTWLALDLHQIGVGGDDSWGAWTHPEYRLTDSSYRYAFRLRPFDARSDDPATLARARVAGGAGS